MKIRNWFIFIGLLFICFSGDFIKPNESFADIAIYRNSESKPVSEEMSYCLPQKINEDGKITYAKAGSDLSSLSIIGGLGGEGANGAYIGYVAIQSGIVLAVLAFSYAGIIPLMISVFITVGIILAFHIVVTTITVYGMYLGKLLTDVLTELFDIIKSLFSLSGSDESVLTRLGNLLGKVAGLFNPASNEDLYATSDDTNTIKDTILATNYYCYNVAGFASSESNSNNLSPYLFKELDVMKNKYMHYPIYPKESIIVNGQCSPAPYIEDLSKSNSLYPFESKCTFTFSPDNRNCLLKNIPYIVAGIAAKTTARIMCTSANLFSIIMTVLDALLMVISTPLSLDPRTLIDFYALSMIATFYFSSFGFGITSAKYVALAMPCAIATSIAFTVYKVISEISLKTIDTVSKIKTEKAIQNIKFCGQNYYSYNGVTTRTDEDKEALFVKEGASSEKDRDLYLLNSEINGKLNPVYEYFVKGVGKGSYAYCVRSCMNGTFKTKDDCKNCFEDLQKNRNTYKVNFIFKITKNVDKNRKESVIDEIDSSEDYKKKDVSNRLFREWVYEGKEYDSGLGVSITETTLKAKPIYDPRIEKEKGFATIGQRYYMRGNEQANFACNRFKYYKGNGCVLSGNKISSPSYKKEKNRIRGTINFYEISENALKTLSEDKLEEISKDVLEKLSEDELKKLSKNELKKLYENELKKSDVANPNKVIKSFKEECIQAFQDAYAYCISRTTNYVCLEDLDANKSGSNHVFCTAQSEKDAEAEKATMSQSRSIFDLIKVAADKSEDSNILVSNPNCEIGGVKFYIYQKDENALATDDDNYACVFSENLCPYNFRLNGGLNYPASYCDAGFGTNTLPVNISNLEANKNLSSSFKNTKSACMTGMFNRETQCSEDAIRNGDNNFNDGFAIAVAAHDMKDYNKYDYDLIQPHTYTTEGTTTYIQSAALGQLKNFCQFRAHCVKLGTALNDNNTNSLFASAFMDGSCTGESSSSRMNYLPVGKRLASDVVECVYETLSNIVNGKAARNKCKTGDLNQYGYCGTDTGETITAIKYEYIKGEPLPDKINPFSTLRKKLRNLVKLACMLSVALWGLKTIAFGDFKMDEKKGKALILNAVKFSIVVTLALNAGWQEGKLSRYLMDFATSAYTFTTKILSSAIETKHGTILNGTYKFGIAKIQTNNENVLETDKILNGNLLDFCYYKSDGLTQKEENVSIEFSAGTNYVNSITDPTKDNTATCSGRFKKVFKEENGTYSYGVDIRSSEAFNDFLYFIDKMNDRENVIVYYPALIKDQKFTTDLSGSNIWNNRYDGCYFSQNEYPQGKEYLMIFDTLDCKILKYFGMSEPTDKTPKILLFVIYCLLLSFIGSILLAMIVGLIFMIVNLVIQTIFIFTSSFFVIGILIFVSPIILPLVLFDRTKKIFNNWLNKIIYRVFIVAISLASIVLYVHITDIITLQGITFENHNNYGRMPTMNTGKYSDLNYFSVINNPASFFTVGFTSVFQAIAPAVKMDISGLSNNKLIIYFFQLGLIFILFKLINDLIGILQKFTEKLFGDKTKVFDSKLGIKGGLGNAAGAVTDKKSGLRTTFQKGGKVARNAALGGVKRVGGSISNTLGAIGNSELAKTIKKTKAGSAIAKGLSTAGEGLSAAGRGVARAANAVRNFSKEAPKVVKGFGNAVKGFAAGDRGKGFKDLGKDIKNFKDKL